MNDKNTAFYTKSLLNCRGKILDLRQPKVMGILNVTPDSFYDGGNIKDTDAALRRCEMMLTEGATIVDVGGMSTKPGALDVDLSQELNRVIPIIEALVNHFPEVVISIDTVKAKVVEEAVQAGAAIVNDISAGDMDHDMFDTVVKLQVPYIMMHMQGTPDSMQLNPEYNDVTQDVIDYLVPKLNALRQKGLNDIIIDPGFGFGKTVEHNFKLLKELDRLDILGVPKLVGLSRKSMICKPLKKNPKDALNGTTALHSLALLKGANILRVHDVKEAMEVIKLMSEYEG